MDYGVILCPKAIFQSSTCLNGKFAAFHFRRQLMDWIIIIFLSAVWILSDSPNSLQMIH